MLRGELCGPAVGCGGCLSHCSLARWVVVGGERDWRAFVVLVGGYYRGVCSMGCLRCRSICLAVAGLGIRMAIVCNDNS